VDDVSFVLIFMPGEIGDRVDEFLAPPPPPPTEPL